jgi:hypothetical protein
MTQPTFVPISEADQVRPARHLHVPGAWTATRAAEFAGPVAARGPRVGSPGPDSGFAMRLAHRFEHDLKLGEGEAAHDALYGVALIAAKRAARFGRAPSIYDVQFALSYWSFLAEVPAAQQAIRRPIFSAVSHDYVAQRALVDAIPEETFGLQPSDVLGAAFGVGDTAPAAPASAASSA